MRFLLRQPPVGGRLEKPDKSLDVLGVGEGSAHLLDGLGGVELRAEEITIGLLDQLNALGRKTMAFESDLVYAIAACFSRAHNQRERRNILRDDRSRAGI